jgi:VWFA-related protein
MAASARALILAVLLILPLTAFNQTQPSSPQASSASSPQAQQSPEHVYETAAVLKAVTRLVVVDVVATDKKGEPAADLKLSDFSLLEDGKEQTIKVFNFQQPLLTTTSSSPASNSAKLPENIYTNIPSYTPSSALNVVLLDALNTTTPNQAYVRNQMIRYLERMPEGRPVAVYVLGAKLRLVQDFTTDPAKLKQVVHNLKPSASPLLPSPAGGPDQQVLPTGAADSGLIPPEMLDAIMSFEQEATAAQTDIRVAYTLNALNLLSRQLAGYPGRKNLVWVSEAFPLNIDPNLELRNVFTGTRNYGPEIAAAAQSLIDAQIAIYPVDARGLVGSSYFSAANSGTDRFGRSLGRGGRMATSLNNESVALQAAHGTMQDLAERTGGKAFYNRNDIDGAIGRSIDDGSAYYTLAYYPDNKNWNGKFRKIHVKADRPGIKLRYRLGYYAVDPKTFAGQNEKQQTAMFGDALSLESPVATALRFHAGVISPSAATKNQVLVNFGLDPHAISFEQDTAGLQHANVECAIAAFTPKGKYVSSSSSNVNAALKPETFSKMMHSIFPCQRSIDLPAGTYVLRLGVRDISTGLIGTTNAKVTVPDAQAASEPAGKKP